MRTQPNRLRLLATTWAACGVAVLLAGCASGDKVPSRSPDSPVSSASEPTTLLNVALSGGTYRWKLPVVTLPSMANGRPGISAGEGPDPTTGQTAVPLRNGTGAAVSDPENIRVRYLAQSWDGQHVGHDSWAKSDSSEPLPAGSLGARVQLLAANGHVGDIYEFVRPARSDAAVEGQSAIIAVEVVSV